MNKTIAVIKWLWDCPLRGALLMGWATYFGLKMVPWGEGVNRQVVPIPLALALAVVAYFWQSAMEQAKKGGSR